MKRFKKHVVQQRITYTHWCGEAFYSETFNVSGRSLWCQCFVTTLFSTRDRIEWDHAIRDVTITTITTAYTLHGNYFIFVKCLIIISFFFWAIAKTRHTCQFNHFQKNVWNRITSQMSISCEMSNSVIRWLDQGLFVCLLFFFSFFFLSF